MSEKKITKLGVVPKATAEDECRQDVVLKLEAALERAKAGDVDECLLVLKHPGEGDYTVMASDTTSMTNWIGKIEALKFEWLMHHWHGEHQGK